MQQQLSGKHVPALDGIRGIAILLVMFHHFFHGWEKGDGALDNVVFAAASRAWMGVDLFLVLSGFLITGILWDAKGKDGYLKNFFARRVLRIFPAYYAVLALFFVVLPLIGVPGSKSYVADSVADQGWFWCYLANFRIAGHGDWYAEHVPNVFWSLAIEEQFYILWPFVVLLCRRRSLMVVCGVLAATALVSRVMLAGEISWVASFVLTPLRWDGLVVGAWLALWMRGNRDVVSLRRGRMVAFGVLIVAGALTAWLMLQRFEGWREDPLMSLRFTGLAVLFGCVVMLGASAQRGPGARLLSGSVLGMFGKYSYALYLWHGPADHLARSIYSPATAELIGGSRLPALLLHSALAGALSLAAALLSWHLLEKHFLKLKGRFRARPPVADLPDVPDLPALPVERTRLPKTSA